MKVYLVTFDQTNGEFSIQAGVYITRAEADKAFEYISSKNLDCNRKGMVIEMDLQVVFSPQTLRRRARIAVGEAKLGEV